jgi:hypothetical protein
MYERVLENTRVCVHLGLTALAVCMGRIIGGPRASHVVEHTSV